MTTDLKIRKAELKLERQKVILELVKSGFTSTQAIAIAALTNPVISLALMVALVELLARKGYINDTERALLVSAGLVSEAIKSFQPITLGNLPKAG